MIKYVTNAPDVITGVIFKKQNLKTNRNPTTKTVCDAQHSTPPLLSPHRLTLKPLEQKQTHARVERPTPPRQHTARLKNTPVFSTHSGSPGHDRRETDNRNLRLHWTPRDTADGYTSAERSATCAQCLPFTDRVSCAQGNTTRVKRRRSFTRTQ